MKTRMTELADKYVELNPEQEGSIEVDGHTIYKGSSNYITVKNMDTGMEVKRYSMGDVAIDYTIQDNHGSSIEDLAKDVVDWFEEHINSLVKINKVNEYDSSIISALLSIEKRLSRLENKK